MKLNKKGKDELRQKIEEELKEVPVGQRVHLDKELLESLLFDTCTEKLNKIWGTNSGKDIKVKYIVWSGAFLSKIDLSEVSFDDVWWYVNYDPKNYFIESSEDHYQGIDIIDLGNTNARIDFSKSVEGKYSNSPTSIAIFACNFSDVDLSNNTIDYNLCIDRCNFSNTNINMNLNSDHFIEIYDSDMSGNDFSAYTVDELFFTPKGDPIARNCNLTNTGLKVKFTAIPSEIIDAHKRLMTEHSSISAEEAFMLKNQIGDYSMVIQAQQIVGQQIKSGHLNGCYINGKKILSEEKKKETSEEKLKEYEKYKREVFDSVFASIEEQKNGMKR